jgi:Hydrolethalus syndrome protein 1 C-terminus
VQLHRQRSLERDSEKPDLPQSKSQHQHLNKQQPQPSRSRQAAKPSTRQQSENQDKPQHQPLPSQHRFRTPSYKEITDAFDGIDLDKQQKPTRVKSADAGRLSRKDSITNGRENPKKSRQTSDKENIPIDNVASQPPKSKMWIRPRSGSQVNQRKFAKKTDPVALYQAYQKDWDRFKNNICESSHSDLRWTIREKMMGNQ